MRAKYDEYAENCRTQSGTDGSNPCRDAMWYYGGHISLDDLQEPLALLWENCRADGRITGCGPLHGFYDGNEQLFADGTRKTWPRQPEKALQALQTGCRAVLEGVANCGSLGVYHEESGDFAAAGRAYATGCETGMTAGADEYYGQGRVCYWAAKNARDHLQNDDDARRWFAYACHADENAFACKFLGLMVAQAEGGEADPVEALSLYAQGCDMVEDITMGDGQSCFLYGQSLVAQRGHVESQGRGSGYFPAKTDDGAEGDDRIQRNLTSASRAFLRGCMDDRPESCKAHGDLLNDWTQGRYPSPTSACRIMDGAGQMAPEKLCQSFAFFLPPPEGAGDQQAARIFVWPDGDRTVVSYDQGNPTLNGAPGEWVAPEGAWECVRSSVTGRSFCYAPD